MIIVLYCCYQQISSLSEAINFILGPTACCKVNKLKSCAIFPMTPEMQKLNSPSIMYISNPRRRPQFLILLFNNRISC